MSNIQVAVRARPLSKREQEMNSAVSVEMRNKATIIFKTVSGVTVGESREDNKEFEYDYSYWSVNPADMHFITQEQVYNDLGKSVLESAFQGYNACVFAYGQTGSGKTHTMMGTEESPGLIPRICENLYAHIVNGSKKNVSYRVEASYMEIYNEKVGDLLQSASPEKIHKLKVREHPREGPYVENLSRHNVANFQEISDLMKAGNRRRVTASTKMNDVSSRSHAIFTILFTQAAYSSDIPCETVSKIHLVDLAGSERASATGAEGLRLKEGGNINKSLACLGNVISALADMSSGGGRGKKTFIPYRDSVLTWLLKDSLGGNSKTIMVATISPAESSYGETLSTLRYSSRAKNIVNEPTVNEDQNVKLIRDLRAEIQRLKTVIQISGNGDSLPEGSQRLQRSTSISLVEDIHKKEEMVAELTKKWAGKWTDIRRIVEEHHLALRSEGVKMVVDSMQPHFVGVDPDILSTGLVFYYLKDGSTTIGAKSDTESPDISVTGTADILTRHCSVECSGHNVVLHPLGGDCFINHQYTQEPTKLSQGDLLQLGESCVLRFNHPHQANKLRRKHNESLSSSSPSPNKAHTLPRRKKRPQSSSHYLIDKVVSTSPSVSSCTMTVELETRSTVTTRRKRRGETSLSLTPSNRNSEYETELMFSPTTSEDVFSRESPDPLSASYSAQSSPFLSQSQSPCTSLDQRFSEGTTHSSPLSSLVVWLIAPMLIGVAAVLTVPMLVLLGLLLCFMRIFGLSPDSWLIQCLSVPLAFCTSLTLSPLAAISHLLFNRTLNFLTFIHAKEKCALK